MRRMGWTVDPAGSFHPPVKRSCWPLVYLWFSSLQYVLVEGERRGKYQEEKKRGAERRWLVDTATSERKRGRKETVTCYNSPFLLFSLFSFSLSPSLHLPLPPAFTWKSASTNEYEWTILPFLPLSSSLSRNHSPCSTTKHPFPFFLLFSLPSIIPRAIVVVPSLPNHHWSHPLEIVPSILMFLQISRKCSSLSYYYCYSSL